MRSRVTLAICLVAIGLLALAAPAHARLHSHQSRRHPSRVGPAAPSAPLAPNQAQQHSIQLANEQYAYLHKMLEDAFVPIQATKLQQGYTPSATPLMLLSPEVSVWSPTDELFASDPMHWAGLPMSMGGAVRIDGAPFVFLGTPASFASGSTVPPTMTQLSKVALATSTVYSFSAAGVTLNVAFSSVVDDLQTETEISRPYGYVVISVNNTDSKPHSVQVYFDVGANWVLDQGANPTQNVMWTDMSTNGMVAHSWRTADDIPFSIKGDGVKMNWGAALMASLPDPARLAHTLASQATSRGNFVINAPILPVDPEGTRPYNTDPVSSSFVWNFGSLGAGQSTGAFALLGYDDEFSMNYFNEWQGPLWRHTFGGNVQAMLMDGLASFQTVYPRLASFDARLFGQLQRAGGESYAALTSIAYRQVTGGIKAVWSEVVGESRWYMKEISSDGDVSTVDVVYPASPFLLAFAPRVLQKIFLPLLDYAANKTNIHYGLPWAPHHLGFWPVCDITSAQQEQMPMEESGNLLIMLAALAKLSKGDVSWMVPYWGLLETWANYLVAALPDPGNQLCTDDFEGPSPHNVNLALKGVVGLGAWSQLLGYAGKASESAAALKAAHGFATQWLQMGAGSSAGRNHTLLQYDLPGTWSQKYNMLFHDMLDMTIFGPEVMAAEIAFYQTVTTPWGLPLDSRGPLTKSDWSSWIAAMVTPEQESYSQQIFDMEWKFLTQGPSTGVPFSDWFSTADGHVLGFRARPVQGGLFAKYIMANKK